MILFLLVFACKIKFKNDFKCVYIFLNKMNFLQRQKYKNKTICKFLIISNKYICMCVRVCGIIIII